MIRKAKLDDLRSIMEIIRVAVIGMQKEGNYQWDEDYPSYDVFLVDIESESLYVFEHEGKVKGLICIDKDESTESAHLPWSASLNSYLTLHRMAVSPDARNLGIAKQLVTYAETVAKEQGIPYIKSDTDSHNIKVNKLFTSLGFKYVGDAKRPELDNTFKFYEKKVD